MAEISSCIKAIEIITIQEESYLQLCINSVKRLVRSSPLQTSGCNPSVPPAGCCLSPVGKLFIQDEDRG